MLTNREDLLNTTVLELTGIMKRLTPVAMAKAVKNPVKSFLIRLSPDAKVGKIGPYVNATLVKIEYMITGNWRAGIFALNVLTNQIFANSHIAHTLKRVSIALLEDRKRLNHLR